MTRSRPFDAVLYGATGFTGKLIARHMEQRGLAFAIAGRNEEKLNKLSAAMKTKPPVLVAVSNDAGALERMAAQARVVVSAAGPFCEFGMPLVQAAVRAGTHYLDTTGEQAFVREVAETLDGPAKSAGVALAPAMGFDVVPGDVAAYLAASALGEGKPAPCTKVEIIYKVKAGRLTRGTIRSLLGVTAGGGMVFRNGKFEDAAAGEGHLEAAFPGGGPKHRAVFAPLAEIISVSRALQVDTVETYMVLSRAEEIASKVSGPLLGPLLETDVVKGLLDRAIDKLPEGPSERERARFNWQILAKAWSRDGACASVVASGRDTYGMTGELLALYAGLLAKPGFKGKGVLSPSRLTPPLKTLAGLKQYPIVFSAPVLCGR